MTQKIIDYQIHSADTESDLEERIKALLLDGWQPIGGVSVVRYVIDDERDGYRTAHWQYSQAVVRALDIGAAPVVEYP